MKPYTRDDAEADLQAALRQGDLDAAYAAAAHLDELPPRPAPTLRGAALWYAKQGLPVFPIQPETKVPYPGFKWRDQATSDDLDQIEDWWIAHPTANIAIATGHHVDVIDFDGAPGHAAWGDRYPEGWEQAEAPVLGTVSTPRPGGLHVYVPATGAGNLAGFCGKHVDYRGLGGYVLVPPSRTEVGTYRWLRPLNLDGQP